MNLVILITLPIKLFLRKHFLSSLFVLLLLPYIFYFSTLENIEKNCFQKSKFVYIMQ